MNPTPAVTDGFRAYVRPRRGKPWRPVGAPYDTFGQAVNRALQELSARGWLLDGEYTVRPDGWLPDDDH